MEAPHILPIIIAAPQDSTLEDLYCHKLQKACNPGIGYTTTHEALTAELEKAKLFPHELRDKLRLNFNIWQESELSRYINMEDWDANDDQQYDDDYLAKFPCYASFDLSCTQDVTNFCCLWFIDGKYIFRNYSFAPELSDSVQQNWNKHKDWLADPKCNHQLCDGKRIDYKQVTDLILSLDLKFKFESVCYDRYNAASVMAALEEHNIKTVAWGQSFVAMNDCVKSLERAIVEHSINHGGNPIAREHARAATVKSDNTGNIKIIKPEHHKVEDKVDIIVSMAMALGLKNTLDTPPMIFFK